MNSTSLWIITPLHGRRPPRFVLLDSSGFEYNHKGQRVAQHDRTVVRTVKPGGAAVTSGNRYQHFNPKGKR